MNYYNSIKEKFINNEINRKIKNYSINKSDLVTYYEVGRLLIEAQGGESRAKYGDGLIKEYSKKLMYELDKKYNITLLKRIRKFYLIIEKGATLSHQLSWSHYCELFPVNNTKKINYYIFLTLNNNLSIRELRSKIKNNEYERLPDETKIKLKNNNDIKLKDIIKNPILIHNTNNIEILKEKTLQKLILEDIPSFLEELGEGFTFIKNEYKIKVGDRYNYIDLLLFNYKYNSFVVIELKITELRKEYIGQIHTYMNYIDINLKTINHNKTIGIIICKKDNKFIMEYCSDNRILSREYQLI